MTGLDNHTGTRPSLVADDVLRLQRQLEQGATMRQVAEVLGVNIRSAYRYARAQVVCAEVAGHMLRFIVWAPGERPRMLDERVTGAFHPGRWQRGAPPPRATVSADTYSDR